MLDKLYSDAENLVKGSERICIATMQRKLKIGYNQASRLMDLLIQNDVVAGETGDFGVTYRLTQSPRLELSPRNVKMEFIK